MTNGLLQADALTSTPAFSGNVLVAVSDPVNMATVAPAKHAAHATLHQHLTHMRATQIARFRAGTGVTVFPAPALRGERGRWVRGTIVAEAAQPWMQGLQEAAAAQQRQRGTEDSAPPTTEELAILLRVRSPCQCVFS